MIQPFAILFGLVAWCAFLPTLWSPACLHVGFCTPKWAKSLYVSLHLVGISVMMSYRYPRIDKVAAVLYSAFLLSLYHFGWEAMIVWHVGALAVSLYVGVT